MIFIEIFDAELGGFLTKHIETLTDCNISKESKEKLKQHVETWMKESPSSLAVIYGRKRRSNVATLSRGAAIWLYLILAQRVTPLMY